jgi:hypothetical protein
MLRLGKVHIHAQARDGQLLGETARPCGERAQTFLGEAQCARRVFALRPMQLKREREVMAALPAILGQERCAGGQIRKSRGERAGRLRTLGSDQVELDHSIAFVL